MDVKFTKKGENHVEFTLKGERHTFPALLKSRLLDEKDVEFASYIQDNPMDDEAKFVVKTKSKSAKSALLSASKKIDADLKDFEDCVKKALK